MTMTTAGPPGAPAAVRDPDDSDGRHYIHPRTNDRLKSVTSVLDATFAKPHLVPWSAKVAAVYAVRHLYRLLRIKRKHGADAAVDEVKQQAKQIRELRREVGSYVHAVVEALVIAHAYPAGLRKYVALPDLPDHLIGQMYDEDDPVGQVADWMITGFRNWVADFRPVFLAAEMAVFSLSLGVAGTLDLIVELRGVAITPDGRFEPCPGNVVRLCIDIKTGKYLDATMPEQIAVYRRMEEALLPMGQLVPMPQTDAGAVVHLRPEHERGYRMHLVSGEADARAFNRFRWANLLFDGRKAAKTRPGNVVYFPRADGSMPSPRIADLDGQGYGAVPAALRKAGVLDLDALAALTAQGCLDLKGIGEKSVTVIRQMLADHGMHLAGEEPPATQLAEVA